VAVLPGHNPWGARALAARARVALARGDSVTAAEAGLAALAMLNEAVREDLCLDIVLPAAEAVLAGGTEAERAAVREHLLLVLSLVAQRIVDEDIRVRWFRAATGAALTRLVGGAVPVTAAAGEDDGDLNDQESTLLHLLVEGHTNAEMAAALGTTEEVVGQQLAG